MDQHPNQFAFFRDMIESVSPIYITEFDEQYQILYSSNPHPELLRMLYREDEKGPVPLGYEMDSIGARMTSPVVFTNSIGMTWLSDVYVEEEKVRRIYLMGPVFLDDFSLRRIEPKVNKLQLSIPRKHEFLSLLRELPVVTLNRYFDYGIMLHRAVTGEVITRDAFLYPDRDDDQTDIIERLRDYHGVYGLEQRMCRMIEEGNLQYHKVHNELLSVSDNIVPKVSDGHLRQEKNGAIVLCTLFSRAAMRGGVEPETVYTMSDFYIQQIEELNDFTGVREMIDSMAEGFARAVHRHLLQSGMSPQIKKICDYIGIHLEDALSIPDLAARIGYSDYYFSNKFKKETGVSVREYIRQKRIERGKELLKSTNRDIQDISMSLGYESVSYFGEIFKKATGMSPGEYRMREKSKSET